MSLEDKKDINKAKDEIIEEIKEEAIEVNLEDYIEQGNSSEEKTEEKIIKTDKDENVNDNKGKFLKTLLASLIDQTVALVVSLALLFLFDGILKLFGFYVVERIPVFFFIYVVINILHPAIGRCSKIRGTLGDKLAKLNK